jgi:hypothetical protein
VAAFPVPAPAAASDAVADLDDYFDRLDSAFANRAAAPPPVHAAPEPVAVPTPQAPSPVVDWFSAPAQEPETGTDDSLPLTFAPPAPAVATPEPPAAPPASFAAQQPPVERSVPRAAPAAAAPPPEPVVPKPAASVAAPVSVEAAPAPAASAVVPALATAHVSAPQPAAAPAPTPRALPTIAEAFAVILEAEQQEEGTSARPVWPSTPPAEAQRIEELPEAVLEQITERVLARMSDRVVREMVAEIAERLVRDEIERIKSSLR